MNVVGTAYKETTYATTSYYISHYTKILVQKNYTDVLFLDAYMFSIAM